jgi:hypothetical protein
MGKWKPLYARFRLGMAARMTKLSSEQCERKKKEVGAIGLDDGSLGQGLRLECEGNGSGDQTEDKIREREVTQHEFNQGRSKLVGLSGR